MLFYTFFMIWFWLNSFLKFDRNGYVKKKYLTRIFIFILKEIFLKKFKLFLIFFSLFYSKIHKISITRIFYIYKV